MLKIRDLRAGYQTGEVLHGISLDVHQGEIVCLIGPNGAGKTTTVKTILGLVRASGGSIELGGESLIGLPTSEVVRKGLAVVPEGRRVFPEFTVEENLRVGAYQVLDQQVIAQRIEEVYDVFPILREKRSQAAASLSGGQQQMLAIGRALMSDPRLLFLDEPSMGLAPKVVQEIFRLFKQFRDKGVTIFLIEQDARIALKTSDRAYVLEGGNIVLEGSASELLQSKDVQQRYLGVA